MVVFVILFAAISTPGVWLSLTGQFLPNNSVVELSEISENPSHSLMCVTLKRPCCHTPPYDFGVWYYPNRSVVPSYIAEYSFYSSRDNGGIVNLRRRDTGSSLTESLGQYCCEIPNASNIIHRLCVQISHKNPDPTLKFVTTTSRMTYHITTAEVSRIAIQFRLFGTGDCYDWVVSEN